MDQTTSKAGWDVLLLGVPLLALLVFGFFRLDEVFTSRKQTTASPGDAEPQKKKSMRSDPDGRPWEEN